MIRHLIIFLIAAGIGGVLTLGIRSAWHRPYSAPAKPDARSPASAPAPTPAADPHAGHAADAAKKPVNSVCAICGMDADPKLTATYREQVIAFGCVKCPAKFAKDPERYGKYFLRNEEAP
jgi:hypothetical protein